MNRKLQTLFTIILAASFSYSVTKAEGLNGNDGNAIAVSETSSLDLPQGVDDEINSVTFYPNPVKDFMTIRFPRKGNFSVTIYNIIGDKVMTKSVMDESEIHLDVSDLQNGLYFISYEYGGKVLTKRFSKIL
jgi:hypothetical protein